MNLANLNIKIKYKSFEDDILNDFYIPVLSNCNKYYRAVGYFTSVILVEYAKGLKQFIKNNGKMKLIISPYLIKDDLDAINNIFNEENTIKLINKMFYDFLNGNDEVVASSKLLIMLLEKGYLEILVAEPVNKNGLFHEKIGLFYDNQNNIIAISGSNNETLNSITLNYESFNTFCNWKEGQLEYVKEHEKDFHSYWEMKNKNIKLYPLEKAIDENLIKLFKTDESIDDLYSVIEKDQKIYNKLGFIPRNYQKDAVDIWLKNQKGIFKFATGAGKTKTSIYLMERLKAEYKKLFFLIVVPDKTLVNQWANELEEYNFNVLKCYSDSRDWNVKLKDIIDIFSVYENRYDYIIVTNDTFFNEKFQRELKKIKKDYLLIVDECHSWGTDRILENLPECKMKLGLSATPELFFSKDKTEKLLNYFGGITYEYPLERAIAEDRLVGYYYYPLFVKLNDEEKKMYDELTKKIVKIAGTDIEDISDEYSDTLKKLLYKRARIIYGAKSKIEKLKEIVYDLSKKGRLLIYCGPTSYKNEDEDGVLQESLSQLQSVNNLLASLGIRFAQYTSSESETERYNAIKSFKNDTYSTLVAIKCLDEGVDIPQIERAIILASSTNPREFIQRRGRILRHNIGKKYSEIYDFIVLEEDYESLAKKEIERFYEFARVAKNFNDLKIKYKDLLQNFIYERGN